MKHGVIAGLAVALVVVAVALMVGGAEFFTAGSGETAPHALDQRP